MFRPDHSVRHMSVMYTTLKQYEYQSINVTLNKSLNQNSKPLTPVCGKL